MKKLIFGLILTVGFLFRLYKINSPLADWHSWRQTDTAAVARSFVKNGYNLLHPRYDDLSNVASGKENPQGYRFVEFPIYNACHAFLFQIFEAVKPGAISFEAAGRLTTALASLGTAVFLYLIVKEVLGNAVGLLTMGFFLFLPYNIYYSRAILPGPMMLMLSFGSIFLLQKWEKNHSKAILLASLIMAAGGILVKPYAIFILIPSWLIIFSKASFGRRFLLLASYTLLAAIPFIAWRLWMRQFPEGIPASQWLLNGGGIRFRPAWWRWLFAERLGKLILGYWGLIIFGTGLIAKTKKKKEAVFYAWLAGAFTYLAIFARGNVQHDYYQILIIPIVAVFLARGAWFLLKPPEKYFYKFFCYSSLIVSSLFMFGFSWYHIREYYKINHPEIIEAGKAADKLLPPNAKVIAPYNGDTAFLYQTNRQGWPVVTRSFPEMIKLGATHYVSVNFGKDTNYLIKHCPILKQADNWVIIDLQKCKGLK